MYFFLYIYIYINISTKSTSIKKDKKTKLVITYGHIFWTILALVMARSLIAPSYYLNQYLICYQWVYVPFTLEQFHRKCSKYQSGAILLTHLPLDKMASVLTDDIFKCIFLNENNKIQIPISLKFIPRSPMANKTALVQVTAWHRIGDKPLPELMMTQFTDTYMRH